MAAEPVNDSVQDVLLRPSSLAPTPKSECAGRFHLHAHLLFSSVQFPSQDILFWLFIIPRQHFDMTAIPDAFDDLHFPVDDRFSETSWSDCASVKYVLRSRTDLLRRVRRKRKLKEDNNDDEKISEIVRQTLDEILDVIGENLSLSKLIFLLFAGLWIETKKQNIKYSFSLFNSILQPLRQDHPLVSAAARRRRQPIHPTRTLPCFGHCVPNAYEPGWDTVIPRTSLQALRPKLARDNLWLAAVLPAFSRFNVHMAKWIRCMSPHCIISLTCDILLCWNNPLCCAYLCWVSQHSVVTISTTRAYKCCIEHDWCSIQQL